MIELTVTKTTNDSGATEFALAPDALQLGAKAADRVDQLHITAPSDWDGCQIRITIRQRYIAPVARIVPDTGTVDISADMLQQSNGTITIDAAKADYHAYTNDICWTAYQHSAAGSASVPQPSEYQQIIGLCQSALATAANALVAANDDQSTASQASAAAQQALSDFLAMLGKPGGFATLDSNGKLTANQQTDVSLTTVKDVASVDDMLALTADQVQPGDVARIVIDGEVTDTYMLAAEDPSTIANWRIFRAGYAANAGHATQADSAATADRINDHRFVWMPASQYQNAVFDAPTLVAVFPDGVLPEEA